MKGLRPQASGLGTRCGRSRGRRPEPPPPPPRVLPSSQAPRPRTVTTPRATATVAVRETFLIFFASIAILRTVARAASSRSQLSGGILGGEGKGRLGDETSIGGAARSFGETPWTVLLGARTDGASPEERRALLDRLVSLYWKPVYWTVRRGWGRSREEAKDLTQSFFAVFLEKDYLRTVGPEKGRFRSFVRAALENFMRNERRDAARKKRGGGVRHVRLDLADEGEEPLDLVSGDASPASVFDRAWAAAVLEDAVRDVRDRYRGLGKEVYFRVFERHDLADEDEPPTYEAIARALGLAKHDVQNYQRHVRSSLRTLIRERLRETVADPADVERELREIFAEAPPPP